MSAAMPNQASSGETPARRRSSVDDNRSSTSSNSSTASQRARVPWGAETSWNWGKAQPNKQRLPILGITLRPANLPTHITYPELAIVTAKKTFGLLDFGYGDEPFKRELYALERDLQAAKSSGQSAPLASVTNFRNKYTKVKFNDHYATLVLSKQWRASNTAPRPANPMQSHLGDQIPRPKPATSVSAATGSRVAPASPPAKRKLSSGSLSATSVNSNSSTESSRAKLPSGPEGSAAWGRAQPKKRVPILDIVLAKKTGQFSYGHELIFKTAKRDFCISDFGFFDAPFKSDLYALKRISEGAQVLGAASPLNIVQTFIKQYPKIKYNSAYAALVKNPKFNMNEDHVVTFLESQFSGRQKDLLHEVYGGIASVTEGPANIPPNERRIVKVDLLPLNASGRDSKSLQVTTYDGKNELQEFQQADFRDQQDAAILSKLLRNMKHAATYRDAGGILRKTARNFVENYPRVDIVAKRLVGKS